MLQIRRGLDLGEEPLGADHRGELRPQHLDRDLAVVLEVLRQIHRRHAARAQLPLDAVAVGEGRWLQAAIGTSLIRLDRLPSPAADIDGRT